MTVAASILLNRFMIEIPLDGGCEASLTEHRACYARYRQACIDEWNFVLPANRGLVPLPSVDAAFLSANSAVCGSSVLEQSLVRDHPSVGGDPQV